MSLKALSNDIKSYVTQSFEYFEEFKKQEAYYLENYKSGMLGEKGLSQKIDELRSEINEKKHAKAEELKAKIEQVHESELKRIEETTESITSDELAELQLIAELGVTDEEMNSYIEKYKRKPLALKKLKQIAENKDTMNVMVTFPRDRKQYLNTILGRWRDQVDRWENMNYQEMNIKVKMYMDNAINSIDEDLRAYEQL